MKRTPVPASAAALLAALCVLAVAAPARAQLHVASVFPVPQMIQAEPTTAIVIDFDGALDASSVGPGTVRVFGRWSGPMSGTTTVAGTFTRIIFTPDEPFFAGEWVTVSLPRTIHPLGGPPMAHGYQWNFWVRAAHGTLDLTPAGTVSVRQGGEGWIQSYGSYAGDLNNDGWSDMSIPNEESNDLRVFLNDGAGHYGSFTITPVPNGANPSTNEGADFDHDGEIDIAIGNALGTDIGVLLGNGAGGWKSATAYPADSSVRGLGVLDLDGDGWDDIVTSNRFGSNVALLLNDGDGTFGPTRYLDTGGGGEFGLAVADANNDGILDVFVGNYNDYEIVLFLGDGVDSLVVSDSVTIPGRPWMLAVGDVDGDGNVDVVSAGATGDVASVVLGDGAGHLGAPANYTTGGYPLAIDLGDIDGDGDLDLVTSDYNGVGWTLYENTGGGAFAYPRTFLAAQAGSCVVLHDRDNDGDLDMTCIDELDDRIFLFDNDPDPTAASGPAAPGVTLMPNHPNPFNPATTVRFTLESAARVDLTVHDVEGRIIRTLARREFAAGAHAVPWDGVDDDGVVVGSGVYFCVLRSQGHELSRKMTLLK